MSVVRPVTARRVLRFAAVLTVAAAVAGTSGCHWFRKKDPYAQKEGDRALELPPEFSSKDAEASTAATGGSVTRSSIGAGASSASQALGFNVSGDRAAIFEKVGTALAAVPGATIVSRAQLLGAYDVDYEGSKFLVRVSDAGNGNSLVAAVDPRGVAAQGTAPAKLIAALKATLAGK